MLNVRMLSQLAGYKQMGRIKLPFFTEFWSIKLSLTLPFLLALFLCTDFSAVHARQRQAAELCCPFQSLKELYTSSDVEGTGLRGIDGFPTMFWYAPASTQRTYYNVDTLRLNHHPRYRGGTGIAGALHAKCTAIATQYSIEWCGQITLDNFAVAGQDGGNGNNAALFCRPSVELGAGETWAEVVDAHDPTMTSNPSTAFLG